MAKIYVSFSPYIAKVLRHELANDDGSIDIPLHVRSDTYWLHRSPYLKPKELKRHPSLREMFESALRMEGDADSAQPYIKAYSEDEYNSFPDSDEKRNELVAFVMPRCLVRGRTTVVPNGKTVMARYDGARFRQACIYYFYELFKAFLHANQLLCVKAKRPFSISEAIHLFVEEYDLGTNEEDALRIQYYRRKITAYDHS